jgi:hypothetical protein
MEGFVGCPLEGPSSCPEEWVAASPLTYVSGGDAPTYLVNSSAEVTPVENATDMAVTLEASGVTASLRIVPGDLHSRQLSSVVVDAAGTTVLAESEQFLREQLDPAPSVFATDPVVAEKDGTVSATSTVRVIPPATGSVSVGWTTTGGTATGGSDYVAASGIVTIPAGQTQAAVTLTLLGDDTIEGDEWFDVVLSAPSGASLGDSHATVYIDEDDAPAGPVVTGVTPKAGKVGASVTISGSGFAGATSVAFGPTPATFTVVSDTQIAATIPVGALTAPVMVTTPFGSATGPTVKVRPTIQSFTPSSGPVGTKVTISGTALTGATGVTIGGVAARSVKAIGYGTLSVKVAPGTVTGKIVVITPGGQATSNTAFTVP